MKLLKTSTEHKQSTSPEKPRSKAHSQKNDWAEILLTFQQHRPALKVPKKVSAELQEEANQIRRDAGQRVKDNMSSWFFKDELEGVDL